MALPTVAGLWPNVAMCDTETGGQRKAPLKITMGDGVRKQAEALAMKYGFTWGERANLSLLLAQLVRERAEQVFGAASDGATKPEGQ